MGYEAFIYTLNQLSNCESQCNYRERERKVRITCNFFARMKTICVKGVPY